MTLFSESVLLSRQNVYKTYIHCDEDKLKRNDRLKAGILEILDEHRGWSGAQVLRELRTRGFQVGRDRFYKLVNGYGLTLNSRKKAWRKSHIPSKPASNLIVNRTFRRVFEVLFSDYTQIQTGEGKLQLLLVEDLVSRCITTHRISHTCTAAPVVEALEESMALKASLGLKYKTIFHTDRGSEYVNHAVKDTAVANGLEISNTGRYHCYENPFMESLNRTLKHSFGIRVKFATREEAEEYIETAIKRYNHEHQHSSLGKRTPHSVLMSYTGKNNGNPEVKPRLLPTSGHVARIYSKLLGVKIKKISLDKRKQTTK